MATFAAAYADGAVVIDVRDPDEYVSGHLPGARLIPLGQLSDRVAEVPHGQRVYVVCASGKRSQIAADLLARAGVDAVSVVGGTAGWQQSGLPVRHGAHP